MVAMADVDAEYRFDASLQWAFSFSLPRHLLDMAHCGGRNRSGLSDVFNLHKPYTAYVKGHKSIEHSDLVEPAVI